MNPLSKIVIRNFLLVGIPFLILFVIAGTIGQKIFGEFGGWIVGFIGEPSIFNIRILILAIVGVGITEGIKITIKRLKKNNLLK